MKTKNTSDLARADASPKNRLLTVIVQAQTLFNLRDYPASVKQVDDYTALLDDSGFESRFGDPNDNFLTEVFMGYEVTWKIEASDPFGIDRGYALELMTVTHNPKPPGNPNFFDSDTLKVQPDGRICGVIQTNPTFRNKEDSYTIQFKIIHDRKVKTYKMDPKLKINTGN